MLWNNIVQNKKTKEIEVVSSGTVHDELLKNLCPPSEFVFHQRWDPSWSKSLWLRGIWGGYLPGYGSKSFTSPDEW